MKDWTRAGGDFLLAFGVALVIGGLIGRPAAGLGLGLVCISLLGLVFWRDRDDRS